jgi:hypothetical protein
MKKWVIWVLLLCAGFPLAAKSSSSYYIYIPPVSGVGKSPEDNALFADSLAAEVTANNHIITENQDKANFILTPELSLISGQRPSDQLYLLHITLTDKKTNTIVTEQDLIYSSPEEADSLLKVTMDKVFSVIADIHRDRTAWRNKLLYLGASAFWSPRIYYGNTQETELLNIGAGISAELQFLNFMSVETGAALVPEWIGILYVDGVERHDWVLEIPLLLKFPVKPGIYHLIEPYGGIHVNYPLYGVGSPPPLSWCAGLQYGIKAGPGMLFIDARFSMDIDASRNIEIFRFLRKSNNTTVLYSNRYQIDAGLGYKFGLISR